MPLSWRDVEPNACLGRPILSTDICMYIGTCVFLSEVYCLSALDSVCLPHLRDHCVLCMHIKNISQYINIVFFLLLNISIGPQNPIPVLSIVTSTVSQLCLTFSNEPCLYILWMDIYTFLCSCESVSVWFCQCACEGHVHVNGWMHCRWISRRSEAG